MQTIQPIEEPHSISEYPIMAGASSGWAGHTIFSNSIASPRVTRDYRIKNIREIKQIKNQTF